MILYDYFRSSASYRVRIALRVKNLAFEQISIHLLQSQHQTADYLQKNPQGLVPTLSINSHYLTQSLAIIEYLEEQYPTPLLLPGSPLERAALRSLALLIACDMHPLNNLQVLDQLRNQFEATQDNLTKWYHTWLRKGFDAFETQLMRQDQSGLFCYGDTVTLPDLCLIPQVYNAQRFLFPLEDYPLIHRINTHCLTLPAFQLSSPEATMTGSHS